MLLFLIVRIMINNLQSPQVILSFIVTEIKKNNPATKLHLKVRKNLLQF